MQIVQIPKDGSVLAVNFESVESFVSARVTRGFESCEGTVFEPREKSAGVVDADFFDFAGEIMFALLNKCFGHRIDFVDAAVQPDSRVDAMCKQIAGDTAAGDLDIQPPEPGATLR